MLSSISCWRCALGKLGIQGYGGRCESEMHIVVCLCLAMEVGDGPLFIIETFVISCFPNVPKDSNEEVEGWL